MRISDWVQTCALPISRIGAGQFRPATGIGAEVERPDVHDDAAHRRAVPAAVLRGRVHDDVGAELSRPLQETGGDGVVHDRSEERSVGKEWFTKCSIRWSLYT